MIAAKALHIAADWNVDHVQVSPPSDWYGNGLHAGGESKDEGCVYTRSLANFINNLAEEQAGRTDSGFLRACKPGTELTQDDIDCLKQAYYQNCGEDFVSEDGLRAVATAHLSISEEAPARVGDLIRERNYLCDEVIRLKTERDALLAAGQQVLRDWTTHDGAEWEDGEFAAVDAMRAAIDLAERNTEGERT